MNSKKKHLKNYHLGKFLFSGHVVTGHLLTESSRVLISQMPYSTEQRTVLHAGSTVQFSELYDRENATGPGDVLHEGFHTVQWAYCREVVSSEDSTLK
jgi:hypothetical protein